MSLEDRDGKTRVGDDSDVEEDCKTRDNGDVDNAWYEASGGHGHEGGEEEVEAAQLVQEQSLAPPQ